MRLGVALILICCFIAAHGIFETQLQKKLQAREDNCIGDDDVLHTLERIDRVRDTRKLPEDGSLDKFAVCILKTYHILNTDGTINTNVDKHWLILDDGNKKSYSKKCISTTGKNNEDTVRKIFECYLRSGIFIIDFMPRTHTMKPKSLF